MLNNIILPQIVANLYNKASLECVQALAEQGLRLELNNGAITGAYMIPDNTRDYTTKEKQKLAINSLYGRFGGDKNEY